jgi:hypothetical protein
MRGVENGTAVFVSENADALDTHLQVNAQRFQEAMPLVAETSIELMGPASVTTKQLTAQYGGSPQDQAHRFRPLAWAVLQALVR